jgi:hypothetical protein
MTAKLRPLNHTSWGPSSAIHGLAPYRALVVDKVENTEAMDLVPPNPKDTTQQAIRDTVVDGLKPGSSSLSSIASAIRSDAVPIAFSPVGGSIDFDWQDQLPDLGLVSLGLHSYLGRYQRNSTVQRHLLMPWALLFEITTRLFRNADGLMEYCQKWKFVQQEQTYGNNNDIRIFNLRPLNGNTKMPGEPFLFKADLEIREHEMMRRVENLTLRGHWPTLISCDTKCVFVNPSETIPLVGIPGFENPQTLFNDTVILLKSLTWTCWYGIDIHSEQKKTATNPNGFVCFDENDQKCDVACVLDQPPATPPKAVNIIVAANGEVWQAIPGDPSDAMHLDDRTLVNCFCRNVDPPSGKWCQEDPGRATTVYHAEALTVGPGLVRVPKPLDRDEFVKLHGEYKLEKNIPLKDVGILQLFDIDLPPKADPQGTLILRFNYDQQSNQPAAPVRFIGTLDFPDLSSIAKPVCARDLKFGITGQPKSFHSQFGNQPGNRTELVADIGVPGFMVMKDSKFSVGSDGQPKMEFGKFELCEGLLKIILDKLFAKILSKLGKKNSPHIFPDFHGIHLQWPFSFPDIPLGGGTLKNLEFDLKTEFRFDFTRQGGSRAVFFTVCLGHFRLPKFGDIDWPNLGIGDLGIALQSQTEPLSLMVTPFVFRFGAWFGFRIKPDIDFPNRLDLVELGSFVCFRGDAGLALAFDVGIARGNVALAISIRYCPAFTVKHKELTFCLTMVSIGVVFDAEAVVVEIINIKVHAEVMATLQLACSNPRQMIAHLVFSGYASVEVLFATIDYNFTVDLDKILGLSSCYVPGCSASNHLPPPNSSSENSFLTAHVRTSLEEFRNVWGYAA